MRKSVKKYKYLRYIPEPFLEDLVENKCIPFIGAGFSKNAEIPTGMSMPLWDELGTRIADTIPDYTYYSAIDALSAYEHEFSRAKLIEKLTKELLIGKVKPGKAHKSFSEVPFDIVCSTNFDFLLEDSYRLNQRHCQPVLEEESLSIASTDKSTKLVKFHGDLHHPNKLVVTEKDYDTFIDNNPMMCTYISNLLITRTAFFVGYSLEDPDFRNIWSIIGERLGDLRRFAYTIAINAKPHQVSRFERRGVKVINISSDTDDYSTVLSTFFGELKDYWENETVLRSIVSEENTRVALSIPDSESNRLCYFTVPFDLYSFYRSEIFPLVESSGLTPIMSTDVMSKNESFLAKTEALINRSEYIVADISTGNSMFELGLISSKSKNFEKTLIVIEEGRTIPIDFTDFKFIVRSENVSINRDKFMNEIRDWLESITTDTKENRYEQPRRLLEMGEYSAAIITAYSLLEVRLSELVIARGGFTRGGFRSTLESAAKYELVTSEEYKEMIGWSKTRNKLVHTSSNTTKSRAVRIVNGVYKYLENPYIIKDDL